MTSASLQFIREELDRLRFEADVAERVFQTSSDLEYLFDAMTEISNCCHSIRLEINHNRNRPRPRLKPEGQSLLEELGL